MADYIDREAAIEETRKPRLTDAELRRRLSLVPAADVRPVTRGRWIQHYESTSDNETLEYGWECSICGRWEMDKAPFCNCGADMREVGDG